METILIVAGIGLLIGLGLILARFAVQVARIEERVRTLEEERPGKRLSHRDTLNVENSAAALVKLMRELDDLHSYAENSLTWISRVRGLADDDDKAK